MSTVSEPSRQSVDGLQGTTVLEFGTSWCGWCKAAQPLITAALSPRPQVKHLRIEDGSGKPLGRSYGVKLWPTLIFLKDGKEMARVVRPADLQSIQGALAEAAV